MDAAAAGEAPPRPLPAGVGAKIFFLLASAEGVDPSPLKKPPVEPPKMDEVAPEDPAGSEAARPLPKIDDSEAAPPLVGVWPNREFEVSAVPGKRKKIEGVISPQIVSSAAGD